MIPSPTSNTPLVSVILPTYNRSATLGRAISSVLKQELTNFELLVVDDASTDDTFEVMRRYTDSRIRYLKLHENRGAHAARNFGIAESRGQYVSFQDSDDESFPGKHNSQFEALQECPSARVAFIRGCSVKPLGRSRLIPGRYLVDKSTCDDFLDLLMEGSMISTPLLFIERELLNEVGGFDESRSHLMEDWELCIRLAKKTQAYLGADSISAAGRKEQRAAIESVIARHEAEFASHPRALAIQFIRLFFYALEERKASLAAKYLKRSALHRDVGLPEIFGAGWRLLYKFAGKLIERVSQRIEKSP
jgi:glycosyltransferase involved in cell wall biosynthesis